MALKWFICPDKQRIEIVDCLKEGGCRMGARCATRSYLQLVSKDRPWNGRPSTTQLIQGTMCAFLKLTNDYSISPDQRAFMVNGTKGHAALEANPDEFSILEQIFNLCKCEDCGNEFNADYTVKEDKVCPNCNSKNIKLLQDITGRADVLETECGKSILADYKVSGSFKVAKALGFTVAKELTGEFFKSGKRKGEEKTRNVLVRKEEAEDRYEWELQLNKYRMDFEKLLKRQIDELRIQCLVRDGNTYIARSRGVFRNIYYFKIKRLDDKFVIDYFEGKKQALLKALETGRCDEICTAQENWDGLKCANYCEVAEFCKYGKFLKQEKEVEDMAIKGLSEIRRLPRLGKIRLGETVIKMENGKPVIRNGEQVEYPKEIDYFKLDPQTPSELENKALVEDFQKLYGEKPKIIPIMFPVGDLEVIFPQFYKRYGSSSSLKCKGNGVEASCAMPEYAKGLKVIGKDERDMTKVECKGKECIYYKDKECSEVATLQILLPEMPGAGVWQITTGSFHSIVNLNSCIEFIRAACGRVNMIPLHLERKEQEIVFEGRKTKHYILQISMTLTLPELQKLAMIDPAKIMLELPEPDEDKKDILLKENAVIDAEISPAEEATSVQAQEKVSAERLKQVFEMGEGLSDEKILEICMREFNGKQPNELTINEADQLETFVLVEKDKSVKPTTTGQGQMMKYICKHPGCKRTVPRGADYCLSHGAGK